MNIIGRVKEQDSIKQSLMSGRPEFLVVFGRRRVGKTYLIREYFNKQYSFYATGLPKEKMHGQLRAFHDSLLQYGSEDKTIPKDWFEAFRRLRELLESERVRRDPVSERRVVFLDEVPWMDTARSDFQSALDYFWNSWGSGQQDFMLIICGSATSWIIRNILNDTGGFHNRVTRRIHLAPFSLAECEKMLVGNGISMTRSQMLECYMVFGGIPFYLNLLDRRLSLTQNIEKLIIREEGELHYEYINLFQSLFKKAQSHIKVIETLGERKSGMLRADLAQLSGVPDGEGLTKVLTELEQCGFIRKFRNYTKKVNGCFFQLIDPFVLFSLEYIKNRKVDSWVSFYSTPGYYSWRGNAFEILCVNHIPQIKMALGIPAVESTEFSWRSKDSTPGAQIDLVIDRKDGIINLCEMKYTDKPYVIDEEIEKQLLGKREVFRKETSPEKAVHIVLVAASGLQRNEHAYVVQNVIPGDALFTDVPFFM